MARKKKQRQKRGGAVGTRGPKPKEPSALTTLSHFPFPSLFCALLATFVAMFGAGVVVWPLYAVLLVIVAVDGARMIRGRLSLKAGPTGVHLTLEGEPRKATRQIPPPSADEAPANATEVDQSKEIPPTSTTHLPAPTTDRLPGPTKKQLPAGADDGADET